MARPTKDGLDYFPLDTNFEDNIELIEVKHGDAGFKTIIKLWQKIYREKGYFLEWNPREQLLISNRINVDINTLKAVVDDCIEYGLFDKKLAEKGILTSRGIQKRFLEATKRRKKLSLLSDLLLINVCNNSQIADNNSQAVVLNTYWSTQSESKVESKKESSGGNAKLMHTTIPEPTPESGQQTENENATTFSFSKLQEEVKTSTGYFIDEKIALKFQNKKIPEEWYSGPESFFAYAKAVVLEKYQGKPESEQRTLFITAITTWENLREDYPAWKTKREKNTAAQKIEKAKNDRPTQCDCGGEVKEITGKLICMKCKDAWSFTNGQYSKLELNPEAHFDLGAIRKNTGSGKNQEQPETETSQYPDVF